MQNRILKTVQYTDHKGNIKTFQTLCTEQNIKDGKIKIYGACCAIIA